MHVTCLSLNGCNHSKAHKFWIIPKAPSFLSGIFDLNDTNMSPVRSKYDNPSDAQAVKPKTPPRGCKYEATIEQQGRALEEANDTIARKDEEISQLRAKVEAGKLLGGYTMDALIHAKGNDVHGAMKDIIEHSHADIVDNAVGNWKIKDDMGVYLREFTGCDPDGMTWVPTKHSGFQ